MPYKKPLQYNPKRGLAICNLIMQGYSVNKISKMKGMPTTTTISKWLMREEKFYERYMKAKQMRALFDADDICDIVDDCSTESSAQVQKAKLQADARKWIAARLLPKIYGDNLHVRQEGNITVHNSDEIQKIISSALTSTLLPQPDDETDDEE